MPSASVGVLQAGGGEEPGQRGAGGGHGACRKALAHSCAGWCPSPNAHTRPLVRSAGELTAEEVERLVTIIQNPRQFKVPDWMLNRKKDPKDGKFTQVVSNTMDMKMRDDMERMKKIRAHRGLRHYCAPLPLPHTRVGLEGSPSRLSRRGPARPRPADKDHRPQGTHRRRVEEEGLSSSLGLAAPLPIAFFCGAGTRLLQDAVLAGVPRASFATESSLSLLDWPAERFRGWFIASFSSFAIRAAGPQAGGLAVHSSSAPSAECKFTFG